VSLRGSCDTVARMSAPRLCQHASCATHFARRFNRVAAKGAVAFKLLFHPHLPGLIAEPSERNSV
jgi:hypothetical protein